MKPLKVNRAGRKLSLDNREKYTKIGIGGKNSHTSSSDEFFDLYEKQRGLCGICYVHMEVEGLSNTSACVDHCHSSNETRGLLCSQCNKRLGKHSDSLDGLATATTTEENKDWLTKAQIYLENYNNTSAWWKLYKWVMSKPFP